MTPIFRSALLGLALLLPVAWSARPAPPPPIVGQAATLGSSDRMGAIALLEDYLAGDPTREARPWVMVMAGEQRRLSGDRKVARTWFERVAVEHPVEPHKGAAMLGMALLEAETAISGNTLATLSLVGDEGLPASMNADRYRILARMGQEEGSNPVKVREMARKAWTYAEGDPVVAGRVRNTLGPLLEEALKEPPRAERSDRGKERKGEKEGRSSSPPPPPEPELSGEDGAIVQIKRALAEDAYARAAEQGQKFLSTWPDSPRRREVSYLIRRAENQDPVVAQRVGVLLPQSGDYSAAAAQIRETIELANRSLGLKLELVFVDSGDGKADAVPKAEALVLEKGCVALMGPMLKEHVMPVAEAAQAMGVPLIALSQSQDPAEVGDYVFRGFLPPEQQVEALLNHAMSERGLTRFAVMYPMTPYGEAARDLFSASVARRGGTTVQLTRYDPKSSSFLKPARELKVAWKGGGEEGFQAIFIPDSWRQVSLIASALAYEEMPVGRFRPRGGAPVLLMGLNGWNNPELPRAGGQYLQGAVFVDAFRAESGNPSVEGFVDSYRSSTGRKPTVVEAVTWDATRLLAAATSKAGADREKLKAELAGAKISGPVAGGDHFGPDREVARSLQVLTISGESIRVWESPLPGSP